MFFAAKRKKCTFAAKSFFFWSVYSGIISEIPTTSNACKASNRHLNRYFLSKNQNIGVIVDVIKKVRNIIACLIVSLKKCIIKLPPIKNVEVKNIVTAHYFYEISEHIG